MREPKVLRDTGTDAVRGIALANLCFLLLTIGDVATVWVLPVAGVVGAMFGRGGIGAVIVGGLALRHRGEPPLGLSRLRPVRWRLVALRSVVHAAATTTWYISWTLSVSLADSYAVGYAAPLLMVLLAVPMLGERLGRRRVFATLLGFAGMLVMLRPGGDLWRPATLLLLGGVAGMAVSRNLTRVLSTTETPECLTFWLMFAHLPVGALLLLIFPAPGVNATVVVAMLVLGISNGVAHWLHARASALAPVAVLAPYEYTGMIWAVLFGYLVFAQAPSWSTIGGAVLVAFAGIDAFYREHRRRRAERALPAGGALAVVALARQGDP